MWGAQGFPDGLSLGTWPRYPGNPPISLCILMCILGTGQEVTKVWEVGLGLHPGLGSNPARAPAHILGSQVLPSSAPAGNTSHVAQAGSRLQASLDLG